MDLDDMKVVAAIICITAFGMAYTLAGHNGQIAAAVIAALAALGGYTARAVLERKKKDPEPQRWSELLDEDEPQTNH